jgi:hypothetical protein
MYENENTVSATFLALTQLAPFPFVVRRKQRIIAINENGSGSSHQLGASEILKVNRE